MRDAGVGIVRYVPYLTIPDTNRARGAVTQLGCWPISSQPGGRPRLFYGAAVAGERSRRPRSRSIA